MAQTVLPSFGPIDIADLVPWDAGTAMIKSPHGDLNDFPVHYHFIYLRIYFLLDNGTYLYLMSAPGIKKVYSFLEL